MIHVVAMPEEVNLVHDGSKVIVTGVGGLNVIKAMSDLPRDTEIHNIGYVGSNKIPVGTKCRIGKVKTYHPNVDFDEEEFFLDGDITCYTSGDFVLKSDVEEPCVFDMELAYIMALGFKHVVSEKIVSDCLDIDQFKSMAGGNNGK